MQQRSHIILGNLQLEYLEMGNGPEVVMCLHGFGREAADFEIFKPLIAPHQRIVAINLFAHGKSIFPKNRLSKSPLETEEWCELIRQLMERLSIEHFHLVGYSMGGRVAMVMMEHMPDCIQSLTLLAPDGLKVNLLYRFVSETKLGRVMYRRIIRNPRWLLRTADALRTLHLLNDKLHRFVYVQLESEVKRQLVYDAWLAHRKLFPDLRHVAGNIQQYNVPLLLIFGEHDAVIPPRLAGNLTRHFDVKPLVHLPLAGHRLLNRETAELLAKVQPWKSKA